MRSWRTILRTWRTVLGTGWSISRVGRSILRTGRSIPRVGRSWVNRVTKVALFLRFLRSFRVFVCLQVGVTRRYLHHIFRVAFCNEAHGEKCQPGHGSKKTGVKILVIGSIAPIAFFPFGIRQLCHCATG